MAEDDFSANLGSLDRAQLQALLTQLQDRRTLFGVDDGVDDPTVRQGAFQNPFKSDWDGGRGLRQASLFNQYKKFTGRKKDKKAQDEFNRQRAIEMANREKILGERAKMVEQQLKTHDLRDKTNQQFRDLELGGLFDNIVQQGLDKSLLGIQQQHGDLARETGFMAVGQGLGGSSVDAERSADISASQNQAVAQAASQAQNQKTQLHSDLDQQRRSLLQSISGANPGEEARVSGELDSARQNAASFGQQLAGQTYGMQQGQQRMAGQSQALGGLLSNYAKLYTQSSQQ